MIKPAIETIEFIYKPQPNYQFLEANRLTKPDHVRSLITALLRGEWIPPIYVTKEGYVVDGQNRYKAFCTCCESSKFKGFLRVLVINSDEDPVKLAIKLNTGQKKWLAEDYFRAYCIQEYPSYLKLKLFLKSYPNIQGIAAALQLIKGSYPSKSFQNGSLVITAYEYNRAANAAMSLNKLYDIIKDSRIFKRDIIVGFYNIYNKRAVPSWPRFYKNIKEKFIPPITEKSKDWTAAYEACL